MPNWTLTYSGLSSLPAFKRWFRAFNLNHSYRSLYNVGSYNSFQSYRSAVDGLGFISNVENGRPQPSSQFDISTVSINEKFLSPLGCRWHFLQQHDCQTGMRRTRVLTLSMASQLLTETHSNDIVVGFGYRVNDFKFPTFGGSGVKEKAANLVVQHEVPQPTTPTTTVFLIVLRVHLVMVLPTRSTYVWTSRSVIRVRYNAISSPRFLKLRVATERCKYLSLPTMQYRVSSPSLPTTNDR